MTLLDGIISEEKGGEAGEAAYRLTSGEQSSDAFGAAAADDEGGGGGGVASAEDQAAAGMKAGTLYLIVWFWYRSCGLESCSGFDQSEPFKLTFLSPVSNPGRGSNSQTRPKWHPYGQPVVYLDERHFLTW